MLQCRLLHFCSVREKCCYSKKSTHFTIAQLSWNSWMQYIDSFDVITYRFSFLCTDGTRLCVNRLWDLQGFELCVGGTSMIYQCNTTQQMFNNSTVGLELALQPSSCSDKKEIQNILKVTTFDWSVGLYSLYRWLHIFMLKLINH